MANEIEVKITGLDELQAALEALPQKLAIADVRAAAKAGAEVVRAEMALRAPKDSGLESEHFDIKTRAVAVKDGVVAVSAFVGPNSKQVIHAQMKGKTQGLPRTAAFLAKLQEFGGHRQGKKPFMTQAWEVTKQKALDTIIEKLREKLGL